MEIFGYAIIGAVVALAALGFYSTMRFNRKKPLTREEYEEHEKQKREE